MFFLEQMSRRLISAAIAAVLVLCLLTGIVAAKSEEPEPFPGYDALCGFQIIYWPTRHLALSHVTPDGREVILLDPILQRDTETARRVFLTAHECAHHRKGHTQTVAVERRQSLVGEVSDQELSADCWAAEILSLSGYGAYVELVSEQFYRGGDVSPGNGYPSGVRRALTIKRCSDAARTTQDSGQGRVRQIARNGAILSLSD